MTSTFADASRFGQLLLLAGALACERSRPAPSRHADTPVVSSSDTVVVRRIPIVYRRPYMLQRATPVLRPLQALMPVDTQLIVRVFDQRGVELNGVRVRWRLTGDSLGASLRVVNAITDSLGLSRAEFVPGPSAAIQGAIAEVPDLGRIEFLATVPANTIRIASSGALWVDEATDVAATLVDYGGNTLRAGALHWGVSDSTRLVAMAEDGTHARARGLRAGSADVIAWDPETGVRGYVRLAVRPAATGEFVTLDGGAIPAMRAAVRLRGAIDSVTVRGGAFSKRLEVGADEELDFDAVAASTYEPVHLRLSAREVARLKIALIPARWRISGGSYDGQVVAIDATLPLKRPTSGSGSSFWRIARRSPGRQPFIPGWREAEFPLRIAFNRARSREPVSAEDSIAFWGVIDSTQRVLGASYFAPGEIRMPGVVPVEIQVTPALGAGHTFVTWNNAGEQYDAVMAFPHAASLRNAQVVTHELLHLLGFGHTTAWPSIMEPVTGSVRRLTAQDVAYVQIALRLRQLQQRLGASPGVAIY